MSKLARTRESEKVKKQLVMPAVIKSGHYRVLNLNFVTKNLKCLFQTLWVFSENAHLLTKILEFKHFKYFKAPFFRKALEMYSRY